jgi:serine phosphatase RsbU (regulator of sigma subunit)/tetratricopeptide (TPR) repeat protein
MSLRYHHKALRMREELGDLWGQGQSYQWLAYCHSWMGNYSKSDEAFIKSLNIFQTIGDLWETGMNLGGIAYCHYMNSSYEKAIQYSREYKIISIKLADYYGLSRCYQYMALSLVEKGDFETAQDYLTEAMNICIEKKLDFNLCVNHICMGALHREQGDYDRALRYFIEARNLAHANSFISEYIVELYNGIAECSLRIAVRESRQAFAVTKKEIRSLKRACLTALRKTWSLPNHRGSALRNYAEFLSAINDFRKAGTLYRRSLAHLSAVGRKFEHARALYSYGLYLRRTGCDVESKKAFQDACDFFTEIGSAAHAAKAARLLGAGEGKDEEPQALFDHHRLASVVDLSQDISSILDLDELFDQIVKKAVGVTGAQRGFLFIKNREHDELELRVSISSLKSDDDGYSRHIVDHVCSSGQTLILTNAESDNRYSLYQSIMRNGLKSVLCLPIRSYETLIGICYLDNPLKRGVFSRQDALSLEIFMAQAGIAIENAHYYAELENRVRERTRELNAANEELGSAYGTVNDAFQIIKEDLAVAQSVQRSLLPHTVSISGLDCYIHYSSVSEIGGDIYDISEISPGRTRVFICDATGHGIQAALITMVIKNEYDAIKHVHSDPAEVLNELNRVICRNYKNLQIVFTCAVADLCLNERTVLFSCAGHPPQYLISGGRILSMEKTGRIIGLMEGSTYACEERTLDAGDRLLFFTDGLFEQFNGSRVAYGEKRLYEAVSRWADLPLEQLVRAVFEDIAAFLGQNNVPGQDDDITFIGIAFDRG